MTSLPGLLGVGGVLGLDHLQTRLKGYGENRLVAGDVGLAINTGEETFDLHDFAGGRIARAMLNQPEMAAGNPSFVVILSLDSGPFSASGEPRHLAAVNGLRDDIGLVAGPGIHVFDRGNDNVRVSRKRGRDAHEGEKRDLYEGW